MGLFSCHFKVSLAHNPFRIHLFPSYFCGGLLARKYPAVTNTIIELMQQLSQGELLGDQVPGVEYLVYKTRLQNRSAGRGKSGGFRVIYYVKMTDFIVFISIYTKTEQKTSARSVSGH
jgi:mRNA-degrading endonuclease RelE of RelBE toxin-antitoxin system